MRSNFISIVLKKEIKDMLRDKRTIITGIILPVILYPIMFAIMGSAISGMEEDVKNNTTIAIRSEVANNNEVMSILEDEVFAGEQGIKLIAADDPVKWLITRMPSCFSTYKRFPEAKPSK
jgi:sodium transport system permease protein